MGRPKKVVEFVEKSIEETEIDPKTYRVFDSKGDFQRDYSEKLSGKGAKEMAEDFAKSINGSVKIA